jgi:mannosyltransferase
LESIRSSRYLQILVILTIVGAFLRLFQLGTASLWLDEATTLNIARQSLTQIWGYLSSASEYHPPLFYWMEHFMLAFGQSEQVLRLIPAIVGILTIPAFYIVGTELFDRNTGILAAALLTFSPFHLFYSQEARDYALMLLLFSLAFFFFLRLLKSWGRKDALLFGIFAGLALWGHFYAFVPLLGLFIFALALKARDMIRDPRTAIPLVISILVFTLLTLPLIYYAVQLFGQITGSAPTFGIQGWGTVSLTFVQISGFSEILACTFLAIFVVGVTSLFLKNRAKAVLLVYALVFPLALSIFLSYRMPMEPRYLIYLLVPLLPGVSLSLRPVCSIARSRNLVYGALILALVINLPVLHTYYTTPQKDDWRGLSTQLASFGAPGDLVIAVPGYIHQPLDYYYHNQSEGTLEFGIYQVGEAQGLIASHPNSTAWFIVTTDIFSTDTQGVLITWLNQHTQNVWVDANRGIFLRRYSG